MRALFALLLVFVLTGPVFAGPVEDSVVRQLRAQGYGGIEVSRTFLGRARITAERGTLRREIVVNPRTGEILRDYTINTRGGGAPLLLGPGEGDGAAAKTGRSGYGNGKDYDDDDDHDDDDGDDRDSDDGDDGDDGGDDGDGGDDD